MKQSSRMLLKQAIIAALLFTICPSLPAQMWSLVKGISAQDIGIGKNGTIWATGTDGVIYRWNGSLWQPMTGKSSPDAVNNMKRQQMDLDKPKTAQQQQQVVTVAPSNASRIAVDPVGAPWVVTATGQVYKYNLATRGWELKPGTAKDIGIGANGTVWAIGFNSAGMHEVYKWNGDAWVTIPEAGGAIRVAVDTSGNAWIVNSANKIFRYNGSGWEPKPSPAIDIAVGANGAIWCTGIDGKVYRLAEGQWKSLEGDGSQISVAPDGNAWVVNARGQVYHSNIIRQIFPRNQAYEFKMLRALHMSPYISTAYVGGNLPTYSKLDPLGQAFGRLGLLAAEILYNKKSKLPPPERVLADISDSIKVRQALGGILAALVITEIKSNSTDPSVVALQTCSTKMYRSMKTRLAKATLDEFYHWKSNPCAYEGLTDNQCRGKYGISNLISPQKPPQDILGKDALGTVLGTHANEISLGVSLGMAATTLTASSIAIGSAMTLEYLGFTTTLGAYMLPSASWYSYMSANLFGAFGGDNSLYMAATSSAFIDEAMGTTTAEAGETVFEAAHVAIDGAIGAASWAGVVAAPVAAAVLCIVVGTTEGFAVVEAAKVEPTLKMKLGAAMTEPINIKNVVSDSSACGVFFIAFQEALLNGFQIPEAKVDGEVRFYCQAGYVSSFRLSYDVNAKNQSFTTPDLSAGLEKSFVIPFNATNIRVQGWYQAGTWKELFNETLDRPTYMCYTSYGTVFEPKYKTDCPEVGNMTTKQNELTVTQGGGYSAWLKLSYDQNGKNITALDQSSTAAGWRQVFSIPANATNIHLQAWSNTGVAWDQWKSIIDKTWPSPPNECIKVYGTTLDPKWDNECN
jgi:hypothetical protein